MGKLEETVDIKTSPERVWSVLRDIERWPEWTPSVTNLQALDGGLSAGARVRIHQPGYRPAVWRVASLDEGRAFAWETSPLPGTRVLGTHTIEATAGGSRVTLGIYTSGPLAPLMDLLVLRAARRFVPLEADGLRRRSEEP
ncbi:MAG TPA: SRPBCC family protein [Dehalococcoidia bacterium]|jgi:uncharacterized protein YndB with AHSA1/START domain